VDYESQIRTPKLAFRWMSKYVTPLKKLPKDGILPPCSKEEFDEVRKSIKLAEQQAAAKSKKNLRSNKKRGQVSHSLAPEAKPEFIRHNEY
jgi:hypothetical protein